MEFIKRFPQLEAQTDSLRAYIGSVVRRVGWKTKLYGEEDIAQEATIVLWRYIKEYPDKDGIELIKIFKKSLTRQLASLFRTNHIKKMDRMVSLDVEVHDDEYVIAPGSLVPWNWYDKRLHELGQKIGHMTLHDLIHRNRVCQHGSEFEKHKEMVMNYF